MTPRRALYVIRHGQTEWNLQKRLQGGRDSPLTGLGERQAEAIAESLNATPPTLILSSALGRAKATAGILAQALDIPMEEEPRLGEIRFGEAEGLTLAEVEARWPGFLDERERDKWRARWPGGESYQDVDRRLDELVLERLDSLLEKKDAGPLAVVGHETTNKILLGRLLNLEPSLTTRLGQPNHAIYRVKGQLAHHAYVGDDGLEWSPGLLQKRSDAIVRMAG